MDMEEQKAETEAVFREIVAQEGLPAKAAINFQFGAEHEDADWDAFTEAAEELGYEVSWYDEDEDEEACIEIVTASEPLTFESLWAHEERLTLLGAVHGFAPDGWGFFEE